MNDNCTIHKFSFQKLKTSFSKVGWSFHGRVTKVVGNLIEASTKNCRLGTIVNILIQGKDNPILGEIVGFRDDFALILPFGFLSGVAPGCLVATVSEHNRIPVGDFLLGHVLDSFLCPLTDEEMKIPENCRTMDLDQAPPNPLRRQRISQPLGIGVRAIDGVLTFGKGQRVGIMAGSGVGKSVLMGMIAKNSESDINVIALIGERGREVREFIEKELGPEGLKKSIIVAVTSDQSPLMRIRGAKVATTIAEYFSSQGKNVLLMLDSLTRIAMAQREVGNSIGEPPTTKGYTPSVFSLLPKLLERAGPQSLGKGSISALYTVLVDGDDFNDPIADCARSLLDGHINLSRNLASKGQFPAIDISTSSSRVMHDIVSEEHWEIAQKFKSILGNYMDNIDLIQIGAYQTGTNPVLDEAISIIPLVNQFLSQRMNEYSTLSSAIDGLGKVLRGESIFQNQENLVDPLGNASQ